MSCDAFKTGENLALDKSNSSYKNLYDYLLKLRPLIKPKLGYDFYIFEDGDEVDSYIKYLCSRELDQNTIRIVPFVKCMKSALIDSSHPFFNYYIATIEKILSPFPDEVKKLKTLIELYVNIFMKHDFSSTICDKAMKLSTYYYYTVLCSAIDNLIDPTFNLSHSDYGYYGDFKIYRQLYWTTLKYTDKTSVGYANISAIRTKLLNYYGDDIYQEHIIYNIVNPNATNLLTIKNQLPLRAANTVLFDTTLKNQLQYVNLCRQSKEDFFARYKMFISSY